MSTSLRTRKKLETYRALAAAARELTLERGFDAVTCEEIAERAGVSPRTFFNYFASKEEAVVGIEPAFLESLVEEVEDHPASEDPFTVLLAILAPGEDSDLIRVWGQRVALVKRHPELLPRHMAGMVQFERALTRAIARRLDVDPTVDPYPRLVVACAMATLRSTMDWWHENDPPVALREVLERNFRIVAEGLEGSRV